MNLLGIIFSVPYEFLSGYICWDCRVSWLVPTNLYGHFSFSTAFAEQLGKYFMHKNGMEVLVKLENSGNGKLLSIFRGLIIYNDYIPNNIK